MRAYGGTPMHFNTSKWRCFYCRKAFPLCAFIVVIVNLSFIAYMLHTNPPRYLHSYGGLVPRNFAPGRGRDYPCYHRLRFADPPGLVTALASAPGSGNTWVRHLLQQATELMTGSMYDDGFLKMAGFPAEGVNNGSVLVVKTHDGHPDVRRHFQRAVLLLRHPRDAVLAEFNRLHGGHVGHAKLKDFEERWESFWPGALDYWAAFNTDWLHFQGPLHVVKYEDLELRLNATLRDLLRFLEVSVSAQDFDCALKNNGNFRRKKRRKVTNETKKFVLTEDIRRRVAKSEEAVRLADNERNWAFL
ncbi:WSCD family member CG9164-like [Littorina saxatilis]|uniref:WSCD family member CG9164-like n=1 Tax=Littorina saxatilis TaxID=31220 RepID=UPI0038B63B45